MEKNQVFANYSKGTPKFHFKIYGPANDFKLTGWAELEDLFLWESRDVCIARQALFVQQTAKPRGQAIKVTVIADPTR
jgi:hypothetical protein